MPTHSAITFSEPMRTEAAASPHNISALEPALLLRCSEATSSESPSTFDSNNEINAEVAAR